MTMLRTRDILIGMAIGGMLFPAFTASPARAARLYSHLEILPVLGHGVKMVPPRSHSGIPNYDDPSIDKIIGSTIYFRIPQVKISSGAVSVESRWDLEPAAGPAQGGGSHGLMERVHGWYSNSPSGSKAKGLLYCWIRDPHNRPKGLMIPHADLGEFVPGMQDHNGKIRHGEYRTELRRAACAGCYPGSPSSDFLKCDLLPRTHYNNLGEKVSYGRYTEWITNPKPPGLTAHPRIQMLRAGSFSTEEPGTNIVEAATKNYFSWGQCTGGESGSCLGAWTSIWEKDSEDERGDALVYATKYMGGSGTWDVCFGDATGTPCEDAPEAYPVSCAPLGATIFGEEIGGVSGEVYQCAVLMRASCPLSLTKIDPAVARSRGWNTAGRTDPRAWRCGNCACCGSDYGVSYCWDKSLDNAAVGRDLWNNGVGKIPEVDWRGMQGSNLDIIGYGGRETLRQWGDNSEKPEGLVVERYTHWFEEGGRTYLADPLVPESPPPGPPHGWNFGWVRAYGSPPDECSSCSLFPIPPIERCGNIRVDGIPEP